MLLYCLEVNGCDSDPCLNGGVCYKGDGSNYVCVCPGTHTGPVCETLLGRQLLFVSVNILFCMIILYKHNSKVL